MVRHIAVVLIALAVTVSASRAQDRLSNLPGYDRYKLVADSMDKLAVGGRISNVQWSEDGTSFTFMRSEQQFRFDLTNRKLDQIVEHEEADEPDQPRRRGNATGRVSPGRGRQRDAEPSPDGVWNAVCRDWNVVLDRPDGSESVAVTTTGSRKFRYGKASWVYGEELDQHDAMWWSPDSAKLAFYEFDERLVPDHYLVQGLTELHTQPMIEGYPKPGEPNPIAGLLIFDLNTRRTIRVDVGGDLDQYIYNVQFTPKGDELLFSRTNRHQSTLEVLAADTSTGRTRSVVTEQQQTWQENRPRMEFLADGHRFIWETERSGWKHYELRDLDGSLINTLTTGQYPVQSIVKVDEASNALFYTAFSDANPLNAQLHRVSLDGTDESRLTAEPLNHSIRMSDDCKWFITEYDAIDTAPTTALCDAEGQRIATLAESDTTVFGELGLEAPELFTFKADDGVTDLYGVLYKPSDFDPAKTYPLVVDVYGGPFSQGVRNDYSPAQPACEFGFLLAEIDNRGTINRGKAFESATYLQLGTVDIQDQADGVRFLAQRPYVDSSRVGIFGHSYGGYMAAIGILRHPDVFQVGVATSAVTDWRNYDSIYTERYMRTPQENAQGYDAGSCIKNAEQLRGKLLILHGVMDDNVHSNNAWQFIDALQTKDVPFEMAWFPRATHSMPAAARTLRWEFLYRHLIAEPASR